MVFSLKDVEPMIAALKLLESIVGVSELTHFDDEAARYTNTAREIIEYESAIDSPVSQSALNLISAILHQRPQAAIGKADFARFVAAIVPRLGPELDSSVARHELHRQMFIIKFVHAVVSRGQLIGEIYQVS